MEKLRKEALVLQEKKDFLAMSVDLLRNNEYLTGLDESEYQRRIWWWGAQIGVECS